MFWAVVGLLQINILIMRRGVDLVGECSLLSKIAACDHEAESCKGEKWVFCSIV